MTEKENKKNRENINNKESMNITIEENKESINNKENQNTSVNLMQRLDERRQVKFYPLNLWRPINIFTFSLVLNIILILLIYSPLEYLRLKELKGVKEIKETHPVDSHTEYQGMTSYYCNENIKKGLEDMLSALNEFKSTNSKFEKTRLLKRKNVLILGLARIGKTFLVKHFLGKNLDDSYRILIIKPHIIQNSMVGKSEKLINQIFEQIIGSDKKHILVFDECDYLLQYYECRDIDLDNLDDLTMLNNPEYAPKNYSHFSYRSSFLNQFFNLLDGNDKTANLNFACIFISNILEKYVCERFKRRFTTISVKITIKEIMELVINFFNSQSFNKFRVTELKKENIERAFNELSVQRILEILQEFLDKNMNKRENDFYDFIERRGDEERRRMRSGASL